MTTPLPTDLIGTPDVSAKTIFNPNDKSKYKWMPAVYCIAAVVFVVQ